MMTRGRGKKDFQVFGVGEFIAVITPHIPPQSYQIVRQYGWFSNPARSERKKWGM